MSKIVKHRDYSWDGITPRIYKEDVSCYQGVKRFALLGEGPDEQQLNFQTRYFEVEAGGFTTLEYHRHPHTVLIIRGAGSMILGDELHDVALHDVIFISPETLHQFHADKGEALGFICIVDRYRDKPMLPDEEYIRKNVRSEKVLKKIRK